MENLAGIFWPADSSEARSVVLNAHARPYLVANRTRLPPPLPSCQNCTSFTAQHKEVHLCTRHTHTETATEQRDISSSRLYVWSDDLVYCIITGFCFFFFLPGYHSRFPATKKTVYHPSSVPHHRHLSLVKKTSESSSVALCGASECSYIHLTHTHIHVCARTHSQTHLIHTHDDCVSTQSSHLAWHCGPLVPVISEPFRCLWPRLTTTWPPEVGLQCHAYRRPAVTRWLTLPRGCTTLSVKCYRVRWVGACLFVAIRITL